MTYVTVEGLPSKLTTPVILKKLSWVVRGHFQIVAVKTNKAGYKTCCIKLSPTLSPQSVVNKINNANLGHYKVLATYSEELPNQILQNMKPKILPERLRQRMHIPLELPPKEVLLYVLSELIMELEYKYTGLMHLSKKTNHKLMENISRIVADRVKQVAGTIKILNSARQLSIAYRNAYPHFGDFQLILSTLHAIEDAQAQPRSQLDEKALTAVKNPHNVILELPYKKPHQTCMKYSNRIIGKVIEHIKNLQKESSDTEEPREEEAARSKVREQLGKLLPYFPLIVNEVIEKHFIPRMPIFYRVRLYGEPNLPTRQQFTTYFKYLHIKVYRRSEKLFNLMVVKVPRAYYTKALETDGTVIADCKLVVRPSDMAKYKIPEVIKERLCSLPTSQPAQNVVEADETWEEW